MEKKTIGKFIAALRRANGMTQRELGDKLFVSDKTVSRWERDECAPDLNLIPVLADIFGVTSDELLRGERNPAPSVSRPQTAKETEEEKQKQRVKAEKQRKRLLEQRYVKYKNLSLISLGLSAIGLIVALLCNFAFYRALLGFALAAVFFVAAVICQTCFVNSLLYRPDDEESSDAGAQFNVRIAKLAKTVFYALILSFVATLPLAFLDSGYYGLNFEFWLPAAIVCVVVAYLLLSAAYALWIEKALIERGLVVLTEAELAKREGRKQQRKQILKKWGIPCFSVAAVFLIVFFVFTEVLNVWDLAKAETFTDHDSFRAYMEQKLDPSGNPYTEITEEDQWFWRNEIDVNITVDNDVIIGDKGDPIIGAEITPSKIRGENGEIVCQFYWYNFTVAKIRTGNNSDCLPITTYTRESISMAYDIKDYVSIFSAVGAIASVATFAIAYFVKIKKTYVKEVTS